MSHQNVFFAGRTGPKWEHYSTVERVGMAGPQGQALVWEMCLQGLGGVALFAYGASRPGHVHMRFGRYMIYHAAF